MDKESIIRQCKQLEVGRSNRIKCCGSDESRVLRHTFDAYVSYCFRSGCPTYVEKKSSLSQLVGREEARKQMLDDMSGNGNIPKDATYQYNEFPPHAVAWLTKAGLHVDHWRTYGVFYSPKYNRVGIRINERGKDSGTLLRALSADEIKTCKYILKTKHRGVVFTARAKDTPPTKKVIVTEDVLSAIRIQIAVPEHDVVSILGTGYMPSRALFLASRHEHIHMWLDGDQAGVDGTAKWLKNLRPYMDATCTIINGKDPKDLTNEEIRRELGLGKEQQ